MAITKRFLLFLSSVAFGTLLLSSCKKDTELSPYTTGLFKFSYTDTVLVNGVKVPKDTTVLFTSVGNNLAEIDDYGYFDKSKLKTRLGRLYQQDFQFNAAVELSNLDLNAISYPYTINKPVYGGTQDAYASFYYGNGVKDTVVYGSPALMTLSYSAFTGNDFSVTLESRQGNRLIGKFRGVITNHEGRRLKVSDGVFDIQFVEK
jgi:hypothetical protein